MARMMLLYGKTVTKKSDDDLGHTGPSDRR
jgi:hypothetical protein